MEPFFLTGFRDLVECIHCLPCVYLFSQQVLALLLKGRPSVPAVGDALLVNLVEVNVSALRLYDIRLHNRILPEVVPVPLVLILSSTFLKRHLLDL